MELAKRRPPVFALLMAMMFSGCAVWHPKHPPDAPRPPTAPSPQQSQATLSQSPATNPPSSIAPAEDQTASSSMPPVRRQVPPSPARSAAQGVASRVRTPKPPAANADAKSSASARAREPSLDLTSLQQRLKDTPAIGLFTKLSLKNQVDDLLAQFRTFHAGTTSKTPPADLRRQYDSLLAKVLSLLQKGDPQLAFAIASSREAIWGVLVDPEKFAKI